MSTAISIEHLSKAYRLGTIGGGTLSQDLARWWARARHKPDPMLVVGEEHHARRVGEQFWALEDVSFDVKEGEVLGIIGRNGAGKSTLLKILSQVTAPTSGQIAVRGRIASLLEVGTGFHPDLTGRENIFLNGAILGMTKAEIRRKLEEIVAFSECEDFIDTPVKRYSSGMYVRLAFAVAAHLEPEVLIVDEVLAVGDAQFQDKCLGKMQAVSRGGRTVLFVSHNMGAVRRLCSRVVLLDGGRVASIDEPSHAIEAYLGDRAPSAGLWRREGAIPESTGIYFSEISLRNSKGAITNTMASTEPFEISLSVEVPTHTRPAQIAIRITNQEGVPVFTTANTDVDKRLLSVPRGRHRFAVTIPADLLCAGRYTMLFGAIIPGVVAFDVVEALAFTIEDMGNHATILHDGRLGVVTPLLTWRQGSGDSQAARQTASLAPALSAQPVPR
jgi:lipopolysaccharide transport system ATP-binding protein